MISKQSNIISSSQSSNDNKFSSKVDALLESKNIRNEKINQLISSTLKVSQRARPYPEQTRRSDILVEGSLILKEKLTGWQERAAIAHRLKISTSTLDRIARGGNVPVNPDLIKSFETEMGISTDSWTKPVQQAPATVLPQAPATVLQKAPAPHPQLLLSELYIRVIQEASKATSDDYIKKMEEFLSATEDPAFFEISSSLRMEEPSLNPLDLDNKMLDSNTTSASTLKTDIDSILLPNAELNTLSITNHDSDDEWKLVLV